MASHSDTQTPGRWLTLTCCYMKIELKMPVSKQPWLIAGTAPCGKHCRLLETVHCLTNQRAPPPVLQASSHCSWNNDGSVDLSVQTWLQTHQSLSLQSTTGPVACQSPRSNQTPRTPQRISRGPSETLQRLYTDILSAASHIKGSGSYRPLWPEDPRVLLSCPTISIKNVFVYRILCHLGLKC